MENSKTLEILKQAILLERRGKSFYSKVAQQADDPDVKEFFTIMAKEEDDHINFLAQQFTSFNKKSQFVKEDLPKVEVGTANEILSKKLKDKIEASSFEAAAIASAIDMENKAIEVYSERAKNAETEVERRFYQWLADWEKGHHKVLKDLDDDLKLRIWNDNQFWPF